MSITFDEYTKRKREGTLQGASSYSKTNSADSGTQSSKSGKKMTFDEYTKMRRGESTTLSAKEWADKSNAALNKIQSYYSTWRNDPGERYNEELDSLLASASDFRNQYAGNDEAISYIDSVVEALTNGRKYISQATNHYAQWDSAEKYTDAIELSKRYGVSDAVLKSKLNDTKNPIAYTTSEGEDITWEQIYSNREMEKINSMSVGALARQMKTSGSKIAYTDADGKAVTWEQLYNKKKREEDFSNLYADYSSRDDWEEQSKYITTNKKGTKRSNAALDWSTDWSYEDVNNPMAAAQAEFVSGNSTTVSGYDAQMTGEELAVFNYIYHTEGKKAAMEWRLSIMDDLKRRAEDASVEEARNFAAENPFWASALSVGTSVGSAAEYLGDLGKWAFTGDLDTNHMAEVTNAIRSSVSEETDWMIGNWDAFDFVYSTAMSGIDSLTGSAVGALVGAPIAGPIMLGLSAAGQATNDALNRGMSKGQAFFNGLAAGTFEALFEKISLGNLKALKEVAPDSVKAIIKNIGKSMLVNASEESLTEIANITYDTFINGELANYTLEELKNGAWKQALGQVAEAGASGALMGFGFGAYGNAAGAINGHRADVATAKDIYGDNPSALVSDTLQVDPNNAFAQKMQERLGADKKLSGGQLAKLSNQYEQALRSGDTEKIRQAVTNRLTELGAKENVETIADVLTKQAVGEDLSRAEQDLIRRNMYAPQVVEELTKGNAAEWAQKIGTRRINAAEYSRLVEAAQIAPETAETTAEAVSPATANIAQESAQEAKTATVEESATTTQQVSQPESKPVVAETVATEKSSAPENPTVRLEEASKAYGAQAGAMVSTYNMGDGKQDVAKFDAAYKIAYNMGKSGVSLDYAMNSEDTEYLNEKQREWAHKAGARAAESEATALDSANRAAGNGKTGRKKGVVKGDGVSIGDLKETFNDPQGRAYRVLSKIAEATGIDIVLYRSEPGADGNFTAAQGKYDRKTPGTIYIDLNAGLRNVKDVKSLTRYTLLRTFSHEFTHFIEKWNPVQYNEFRKVVFDELTRRGEDVNDLIELKMEGGKLSYEQASREVVAEAMVDILPDSRFVEMLANKHKRVFDKLLEKLKDFVADLKAYFKTIGGSYDRGAVALKEQVGDTIKYLDSIVDMFDTIAVQAVENFQQTVAIDEVVSEAETKVEEKPAVVEEVTEAPAKPAESVTETSPHGFTISDNAEYGSLEIKFDEKPSDEVRHVLKENKFKWHKVKKVWFGFTDRQTITDALNSAYESADTVAEPAATVAENTTAEETPERGSFEKAFWDATQAERDEVVEAMSRNTKLTHMAPTEIREQIVPEETAEEIEEDSPAAEKPESQEITLDKRTVNMLRSFGRLMIANMGKETYITNGAIVLPVNEADILYATNELGAGSTSFNEANTKLLQGATTPIEQAPTEAKHLNKGIYIFDIDGKKRYFDKKMLSFLDGGTLYYGKFSNDVGLIKSVNEDGSVKGYLLGMKAPAAGTITDEKASKLKSFAKKKVDATKPTENKEGAITDGKESETGSDTRTVHEPVRGSEGTARLLEGVEPETVRGSDEGRQPVRAGSDEGTDDAGRNRRTDAAGSVSERSPRDSVAGDLQQLSGVTEEPGTLTSHAAAKEYAESKGYRIELNKLAAKKNMIQVDIRDKQGLPTFNPVIIGELGKDSDPSAWNKVKEAIDKREAESVTETETDINVGSKMTDEEAEQLHEEVQQEIEKKSTPTPKGSNFVIGDSLNLPNGTKARTRANIDAIKLVKKIAAEDRVATPAEQEILSKYVGWGGLADAFGKPVSNHATRKIEYEAVKGLEAEFEELKSVLTEEEYKAARESTKNAHYTSVEVIKAMYDGLKQLGFTGGRMLEPSSGVGNFVGAMPADMTSQVKSWTMVELDNITGMLAKYLYPNSDVRIQGFEETNIPDGYMDVAIGNVPFGNYAITDKHYPKAVTSAIHNYFFAKALDKVRPGGVVMFITSSYTMNGRDNSIRKYMMQHADLLGAIRLPNTAFSGNAGTSVVTDILVLKKREAKTEYSGESFTESNWERMSQVGWDGAYVNEYFVQHPEMVLGTPKLARGMYSANELTVDPFTDRGPLGDQIREAFKNIKGKMEYTEQSSAEKENVRQAIAKKKRQKLQVKDGVIQAKDENGNVTNVEVDKDTAARITGMVEIRDAHTALCDALQQGAEKKTITSLRKALNKAYDTFVDKYGYLNANKNKKAINQFADRYSILSLENYSLKENASGKGKKTEVVTKSDIFSKDTIAANRTAASAENVEEGLTISLNTSGTVDVSMIARLTGQKVESVTRQLIDQRLVFKDKNGSLIPAVQYLSGNVRAKLREMEGLVGIDPDYRNNVEALREVVPPTVEYSDIYVNPGATWVPVSVYEDFVGHILKRTNFESYRTGKKDFTVEYVPETNEYKVTLNDAYAKMSAQNTQVWGESGKAFSTIFENMLNGRRTNVYMDGPDGKRVLDKAKTEAVAEKVEKLNEEFRKWLWEDETRRGEMQDLYNESYNALVTPKYSGASLTVNGLNSTYSLRDHQKDAVARIINSGGNTLLAHRVGAGKTMEMAAAAMKLKQLGVIKKPMFVVPNNVVAQWGNEFKDYFPAANILLVGDEDMTPAERMTTINKIKNNDYDAVILAYTKFEKIQMTKAWRQKFYEEQIDSIMYAINAEKEAQKGKGFTVKQLENKRKQLEAKLKKLTDKAKDEDGAMFEDLGVDSLFVDEAHNFKNLEYTTRMTNVSGLGKPEGAQRSFDLYTKIRYLQQLNGGRGVVFATATPVMNSMTEMYIMQKYLQPDTLKQLGVDNFDSWAKMFGEVVNALEIAPSGSGYRLKQTFSKFKNVKALQQLFRSFTDVLTDVPGLKIPKMKGGKVQIVECEQGEFQKNFMAELAKRAENVKNVDPTEDNMLKITSDGRKISYSQRMIDPSLPYEETGKIYKCCENVYNVYKESSKTKGTQMIFCDMATPKGKASTSTAAETETDEFSDVDMESAQLYDDIKERLVQMGIPAKEIAFIHDAKNDKQKAALSEKMNNGTIRVLLGSTGKMGVGLNAQKKAVAIHHLDAPWRPGDIEQRDGRVFRQKNENEEAYKFVYVTKGSFDSRLWDILERKQKFINQVMNGDDVGNEIEDTGEVTLSAAEVKAVASDNPLIMEQVALEKEISKLQSLQQTHRANVAKAEEKIGVDRRAIANLETRIENIETDIQNRKDTYSSDKVFSIQIGNQKFTDKKEAGVALMAAAQAKAVEGSYNPIGKFAGFTLRVVKTPEGIKGVVAGAGNYAFKTYPLNTTYGINHLIGVVEELDNDLSRWNKQLAEAKSDLETQKKLAAEPFEQAEKLREKRARYNEVMYILNPPVEQNVSEDTVQEQSRGYLDAPDDIREDIYYPKRKADASAFLRSYANKTSGMKDGEIVPIVVYTADDAYFVVATGYLRGEIEKVMPILGNEDTLREMREEFINGTDTGTETPYSMAKSYGDGRRRNGWDNFGARYSGEAGQIDDVDVEEFGSDPFGDYEENFGYPTYEEFLNAVRSGVMVMDYDGNPIDREMFNFEEDVEETKDLIAVHNLREDSLLEALEMGGLPMPSIAVMKKDHEFSDYGDISIVFKKETIAPETDSRNRVYGADVFTPTKSMLDPEQLKNNPSAEDIVEALKQIGDRGVGLGEAAVALAAVAPTEYKSVAEIKADKDRLGWHEDENAALEAMMVSMAQADELMQELSGGNEHNIKEAYSALISAAKKGGSVWTIRNVFNSHGFDLSSQEAQDIHRIYREIGNMRTMYFEAKPERVIRPYEWALIAVPSDLNPAVRKRLDALGANIVEYERGNAASRREALNSDPSVQFQQRTNSKSDREVLEEAAENVNDAQFTDAERDALNIFKKRLTKLHELEEQRAEQGRLYKEQQFGTNVNREEAAKTLNRMHLLDDQIRAANDDVFDVEEKAVLRKVLQKARRVVEQDQREHDQETLKRYRDRRNNAEAIKKYRERLRGDVDELTNWILHPDNKNVVKHVPDALKDSVIPFLSSINFMSKRQLSGGKATAADKAFKEQLGKLAKVMGKTAGLDDMYANYTDLPPDFMDNLRSFQDVVQQIIDNSNGEFVINQMTSEELRDLSKLVRTLKKYIMQMNNFHVNAMFRHVYEAGDNSIDFLSEMKPAQHTGALSNFTLWQQMRPAFAFERFGKGGQAIYDGLRRGQATLAFNTEKIKEFSDKAYSPAEVRAWEKQVKTIQLGAGRVVKMPVSYIMGLYELSKREQAKGHIFGEGIRVATFTRNGKKISDVGQKLTPAELNIILKELTPRQIEVADKLQQYMQQQGGEWGNYVTLARFGEKQFGEENYYPINSDGRHLQVDADEGPKNAALYALLNMGFTKQTQEKAKNRLVVYSIFDVFSNHMASMAQYNAFALPVIDALKWFNYQQVEIDADGAKNLVGSVREQMDRVYGVPEEKRPGSGRRGYAQNFVINIIKAFNGTEAQGTPYDEVGMQTLHKYNRAQVAYNFRVVVQQPLAITRAALLVDYRSIIKGMNPAEAKKNIAEMRKYSGIAAWKALGFYDVNISRGLTSIIKHDETGMDKVIDFGMKGAETADTLTWAGIWGACKAEVIRKRKLTPKSEGFYEAVTKLFEDVIYKTQVVDSVLTKNEFMRDKGFFARAIGSFMSEPTTTASMLVDAFDKYQMDLQRGMTKQQAWKKNGAKIGRTACVYGVGAILLAAAQAAADALRDDDEYETLPEKWWEAFGGNFIDELMPFNKLPILSDFYEVAKELISTWTGNDNIYGNAPSSVIMQWYDSLVKGSEILRDKITGEDTNYTWYGGIYKLLQAASGIAGLPMAAATREIITAWNNTIGAMAPSLKVKTYDPGDKNNIKYAYQDGYLTDEEATEELISKGVVDTEDEAYWLIQGWEAGDGYSRYDAIYDAVRNGGDFEAAMEELTSHGYTEKEVLSEVKGKIGKWYKAGEISKQQAIDMLTKHMDMDSDEITTTVNKWSAVVVTGMEYDDIKDEFFAGNITATRAIEMRVKYGGQTKEDATKLVNEWRAERDTGVAYDDIKKAFKDGELSRTDAVNMYVTYGGYSYEDANAKVEVFEWQRDGFDIDDSNESVISDYHDFCEPAGVDKRTYFSAYKFYKDSGEEDVSYSKVKETMPYIDSLPISAEQKWAIARCWWKDSTIEKYKLW